MNNFDIYAIYVCLFFWSNKIHSFIALWFYDTFNILSTLPRIIIISMYMYVNVSFLYDSLEKVIKYIFFVYVLQIFAFNIFFLMFLSSFSDCIQKGWVMRFLCSDELACDNCTDNKKTSGGNSCWDHFNSLMIVFVI